MAKSDIPRVPRQCSTCSYYVTEGLPLGECRRYPTTSRHDVLFWCGEYSKDGERAIGWLKAHEANEPAPEAEPQEEPTA